MNRKSLSGIEIKDAEQGKIRAVFATLNVIDHDGDVTLPGAFTDGAEVRISVWNHGSWGPNLLPVGKGTIREEGNEAILEAQFFMGTEAGRDHFTVVKELGPLCEWSYGYDVEDSERGTKDGKEVTFLKQVTTHEVSPVILGAGLNTRTLAAKAKQLQSDVARQLEEAGRERWGAERRYVYVRDYDPDQGFAIFNVYGNAEDRYVRVSYSRSADGEVALGADEVEVEIEISYEPKARQLDDFGALKARVAELTGVKSTDLPDPLADEGLRDYDARLEVAAVEKSIEPAAEPDGLLLEQLVKLGAEIRDGVDDEGFVHYRIPADAAPAREKLSDQLASVTAEVEQVTERVADVAKTRAEKGKELGEASAEAAERLEAACKQLREVLASAATDDNAGEWAEGLDIEDDLIRAEL